MPLELHVESGPCAHAPIPLEPGAKVQFGRTNRATISLPEDGFLSGLHFEVESDGQRCVLRDLGSSNGTLLRGSRVTVAELQPGDSFTAGQTVFALIETAAKEASAPAAAEPEAALPPAAKQELLRLLRTTSQPLYAVLDAARDPRIMALLKEANCEHMLLFHQGTPPELLPFSPYLASLPPETPVLEKLIDLGWTRSWGIYIAAAVSGAELLQRLRHLLVADLPDGQSCLLRFYDPRVLPPLLSESTPVQRDALFGGVRWYVLSGEDPETATIHLPGPREPEALPVPLSGSAEEAAAIAQRLRAQPVRQSAAASTQRFRLTEAQASALAG